MAMEIAHTKETFKKIAEKRGAAIARACAMSNSVGGIGPLLKERIAAQAELGLEVIGISLLYENVWVQRVFQWGQIDIEKRKAGPYLREVLEDTGIHFTIQFFDGTKCEVKVWKSNYGLAQVYFLDAPEIANVIYPGPEDAPEGKGDGQEWVENQKFKQGWLVGRGALQLLKILNKKPDFIVQSEVPAFFANHFLVADSFQNDPFFSATQYIFNDHTPLEYAHPFWNEEQIKKACLDEKVAKDKKYWNPERNGMDVTQLLISVSHGVFGVSKKHERVMKSMNSLKGFTEKICSITNGVGRQDWQHPDYRNLASKSDEEVLAIKEKRKAELVEWVWKRYRMWVDWRSKVKGKCFVLWTRRVTSYKRFDVLERLLKNPEMKKRFLQTDLAVFVGGRIHQNDNLSQNVVFHLLDLVGRDPEIKDRVMVLDNYNIWEAPNLFHGADATIMLADDGREASATGFMKAQLNGALVIASNDGAIPESVVFGANGIEVPYVNGQPEPAGLLHAFEELDAIYKNPKQRAQAIRSALSSENQVSMDRVARQMLEYYQKIKG